ncbi:MAG: T9SS type A sorting domain-containing protein [Ignavibacteriales bacterium]|nr:T9SS type A sorting domain-containing protein [Ignavibacteriales bacterium]
MRNMFLVMVAVLLIAFSGSSIAQFSSELWLKVSDNKGSAPYTMMYGNHVNGTYGEIVGGTAQKDSLNPTIIERESPPLPPGLGVVWRPSRSGVSWGVGFLTYDFKGYASDPTRKDTFKVFFSNQTATDADITIEWPDATYLGARCSAMTMKIGADVYDMFAQTSVVIPAAGDNSVTQAIIYKTGSSIIDNVKQEKSTVPAGYKLGENYPNPFNPSTTIIFDVLKSSNIEIAIYNVLGQKVTTLVSNVLNPGSYSTNWNAASNSTGVYYVRMTAKENGVEQFSSLQKILFVK